MPINEKKLNLASFVLLTIAFVALWAIWEYYLVDNILLFVEKSNKTYNGLLEKLFSFLNDMAKIVNIFVIVFYSIIISLSVLFYCLVCSHFKKARGGDYLVALLVFASIGILFQVLFAIFFFLDLSFFFMDLIIRVIALTAYILTMAGVIRQQKFCNKQIEQISLP